MAYKRKRSSYGGTSKRRRTYGRFRGSRFARRRIARGAGGTRFNSAQAGTVTTSGWRTKKISRRRWRKSLWDTTRHETHWRSIFSGTFQNATPNVINTAIQITVGAITGSFWTVGEGLQPQDATEAAPFFAGDLVLRGGMSKMTMSNNTSLDSIKVKVWTVWTTERPDFAILPTPVPPEWDPSIVPEFERFGKPVGMREFFLLPGNRPVEITYRYKPRKIDKDIHAIGGHQLFWIITAYSSSPNDTGDNFTLQVTQNVSFSGDVESVPILPPVAPSVVGSRSGFLGNVTSA